MSRFGTLLATTTALAVVIALAGCSSEAPVIIAPSPSPTFAPTGDGVLRIGTILPPDSVAQVAGVEVAVREINEQGGIGGAPVELYHRSSGDPASPTAEASLEALVALGVDVVIGPDSADLAERLATPAAAAGVVLISPSAVGLGDIDDSGFVFTTAVAGSAQVEALAASIVEAGASSIA